jgi:outer membrane protein assembly factor BamB
VHGEPLVFFAGGDGVVYAFQTIRGPQADVAPQLLQRVWRFDCDPTAPKEDVHRYHRNRRESPSNIKSMPVFHEGRVYVTVGGDIWWGKNEAWLKCIDASQTGDVTTQAQVWSYPVNRHCCTTPAIDHGMAFVGDCSGVLHCVDIRNGQPLWTHEGGGEIWSSPLVADGKVYQGTRRGSLWVFAATPQKQLLATVDLDEAITGTPVAANGTLYLPTESRLYALQAGPDPSLSSPAAP